MEKIIGKFKVYLETILDPEGEVIYHKVTSPMFNGNTLSIMNESDLTEDLIEKHIDNPGVL